MVYNKFRYHAHMENWSRGYKNVYMLNSSEHEISSAHKKQNAKK